MVKRILHNIMRKSTHIYLFAHLVQGLDDIVHVHQFKRIISGNILVGIVVSYSSSLKFNTTVHVAALGNENGTDFVVYFFPFSKHGPDF